VQVRHQQDRRAHDEQHERHHQRSPAGDAFRIELGRIETLEERSQRSIGE